MFNTKGKKTQKKNFLLVQHILQCLRQPQNVFQCYKLPQDHLGYSQIFTAFKENFTRCANWPRDTLVEDEIMFTWYLDLYILFTRTDMATQKFIDIFRFREFLPLMKRLDMKKTRSFAGKEFPPTTIWIGKNTKGT